MKTLMAIVGLGIAATSVSALALDAKFLTFQRTENQTWVVPGGMVIPADESVADIVNAFKIGVTRCEAKFFHTAHVGTHAYVIYDLKNCQ